jgi:ribosome-interacting GTPase 1
LKGYFSRFINLINIPPNLPTEYFRAEKAFIFKKANTVEELKGNVHHDSDFNLKTSRVWWKNVFDGQMAGRDHILHDKDIVELHL